MSIAWATVVIVVLLLPGFAFLAGLYFPEQVTRESTPISALGQLALVVGISFVLHGLLYCLINRLLCQASTLGTHCVSVAQLIHIMRIDGSVALPLDLPATERMFHESALQILVYFGVASALAFAPGLAVGMLIERGSLGRFAKHRWMHLLNEGRRHAAGQLKAKRVRANVLSRSSDSGKTIVYVGIVEDFYARADGTISHLVLRNPSKGFIDIQDAGKRRPVSLEPLAPALSPRRQFLVLTSEDIANVFFEEDPLVSVTDDELARIRKLVRAQSVQEPDTPNPPDSPMATANPGPPA